MAVSEDLTPTTGVDFGRPGWTLLASSDLTGGAFELFSETRPTLSGPPRHVHRDRDEGFYILEGRYLFERSGEEVELLPGSFLFIPRGTKHSFRTLEPASRTLILVAPAGLQGFFREMGVRIAAGATALEAMTTLSATHDSHPVD